VLEFLADRLTEPVAQVTSASVALWCARGSQPGLHRHQHLGHVVPCHHPCSFMPRHFTTCPAGLPEWQR
jgi:hypothetical protein